MINPSRGSSAGGSSAADSGGYSRSPFGEKSDYAKFLLLLVAYTGTIIVAHWVAYLIRFEFRPSAEAQTLFWRTLQWQLPLELACLYVFGQFRSLLSYFSFPDANRIVLACATSGASSLVVWYTTGGVHAPPRSIILLSCLLDTVGLVNVRVAFRRMRERQRRRSSNRESPRRVAIIGAGDVGANLAKECLSRRDLGMLPVAFYDDDPVKWNLRVHGVPVLGRPELLAEGKTRVDEVIFAMPSAAGKRVREIVQVLNGAQLRFETVPSLEQLVNGDVRVSQIRPVELEDLLGRDPVILAAEKISDLIADRIIMVTGAGGSIGSELCRQILGYHPRCLLLVERCEVQIFQIEQELLSRTPGAPIEALVADVLDETRMRGIFERFNPEVIFHAAAHKHVPMMESQPYEAFRNNTIGTKKLANLAAEFGVDRFILISTDKAINPTNVMGATKRLAELYLQALQRHNHTSTKFMAVRFGNVLGSSGSVIPTFKRQIAAGGPVTVTHPDVTRYFMTIPEAAGLVLQSATQGQGGEIFVLDMGKLVKIADVARQLIELSGLKPDVDIEIKYTGLRPGEKLFEELNLAAEDTIATDHPKVMSFVGVPRDLESFRHSLLDVQEKAASMTTDQVKLELQKLVPEYNPYLTKASEAGPTSSRIRAASQSVVGAD